VAKTVGELFISRAQRQSTGKGKGQRVVTRRGSTSRGKSGGKLAAAVALGSLGGKVGGPARNRALSGHRKSEIAAMGARAKNKGE
jgi:hypothetical protein